MVLLKERSRCEQFEVIDGRVRFFEKINRTIYTELGILVLYVQEQHLWDEGFGLDGKPLRSFEQWIQESCPYSASYAKDAKEQIKILRDSGAPMDQLVEVPRCNIRVLAQLPPVLQRDTEVLRDAQTLTEDVFRGKLCREHPEAHLDPLKRVKWQFEQGAWEVIDEAIHRAMAKWDCGQQAAIEGIFAEWLVENKREEVSPEIGQVAHA